MKDCDILRGCRSQLIIATNGNRDPLNDTFAVGRGAVYGTYAVLEQLGFAFLHPLSPTWPSEMLWSGLSPACLLSL
jgi:hypothetical protein